MKIIARPALILLGGLLVPPQHAAAGPLGIAGAYNLFVFGDIVQVGTDVEGRVAAGGNITYGASGTGNGFSVASSIAAPSDTAELVAGRNVTLTNGSVGNAAGTIVYGSAGSASVVDVGYGVLVQGDVVDFAGEQSYLTSLSEYWGSLTPNGTNVGTLGNIDLTGTDPTLNIFRLAAADIVTSGLSFDFHAPFGSTILVNVTGEEANMVNFGFSFNGIPGEPDHGAGYPYDHILFNFHDATDLNIDLIAIDGSILAPYAHVDFGRRSHIDGNLIALSLAGDGESHNVPFVGEIPIPEPITLVLLASGLGGLAARRRRRAW